MLQRGLLVIIIVFFRFMAQKALDNHLLGLEAARQNLYNYYCRSTKGRRWFGLDVGIFFMYSSPDCHILKTTESILRDTSLKVTEK